MATNSAPSVSDLLSWFDSQDAEIQASIGDPSTDDGFTKAMTAFLSSNDAPKVAKREHTARPYEVMILISDSDDPAKGSYEARGTHVGSPGRAPTDPSKFTDLQKAVRSAEVRVLQLAKQGIKARVLSVLVEN
jgi:hypothetical protein